MKSSIKNKSVKGRNYKIFRREEIIKRIRETSLKRMGVNSLCIAFYLITWKTRDLVQYFKSWKLIKKALNSAWGKEKIKEVNIYQWN